ncbi:Chemotaxis signal transduction protein [Halanaeroarchaeum sp. HSR-CO]|uniref:chemotaxis protein CheW n=1 Tax=Halanaeroarchaeum sp. HSR-CO TaxID=2866382 RepID=UPI00217EC2B9|nr:chemotaxis protein CheW [Halanaeroarchaeum sp. HSR-CO]UWG48038.1 Chemotaxis signal transduction protein [Halanaeroarchaeum sp. HSR-CO]
MAEPEGDQLAARDVDVAGVSESAAHVVEFALGEETCAMDIDFVDSIVETKQITRVPRAPDAVEGVMDLRGETTAVVDPREFLSVGDGGDEENILVLDRDDDKQKIGIRVDEVNEVSTYSVEQVDRNGDLGGIDSTAIADELVKGVIRKPLGEIDDDGIPEDVRLILWLDIEALIGAISETRDGRVDADNQV